VEAALQAVFDNQVVSGRSMAVTQNDNSSMSLEQAFREHKDHVFRAAYRITGSASDAEDVLQSVFLKLARRQPGEISPDIQSLGSYLHRAAVNAALDTIRMRRDAQNMAIEDAEVSHPLELASEDEGEYSALELRRWLRQAIGKLGARPAEMFVLRYIEGRDNREIATMMKTTRATVAVTLHRTRSLLKNDFRRYMEGTK
jgi:RNA polymerase sigma-70 factor (ECF subfamily)